MDTIQQQSDTRTVSRADIDAHLLRNLFSRVRPLVIANVATSIFLVLMLWNRTDPVWLALWGAALIGWTMMRFMLARAFLARPRAATESRKWIIAFSTGSGVNGILWGLSVVFFANFSQAEAQAPEMFVMGALTIAALAGYSNNLYAFGAFLVPALLPYGAALAFAGGVLHPWIGGFFCLWMLLAWVMAIGINEGFAESVELTLRNSRLVDELTVALRLAEAANTAKTRFIANMSHELRTPLNAVIGYSELMVQRLMGPLGNAKYEDYAESIHRSGVHLLGFVEDILKVSELESGEVELDESRFAFGDLQAEIVANFAPGAEADGVTFIAHPFADAPWLHADRRSLGTAISHLVSNALKFTPEGGKVELHSAINDDGSLLVRVTDTGVGIAPEILADAVVPFAHIQQRDPDKSDTMVRGGPGQTTKGLGLPMVRLLTELHGGRLSLDSTPGKGTVAEIHLPKYRLADRRADDRPRHAA